MRRGVALATALAVASGVVELAAVSSATAGPRKRVAILDLVTDGLSPDVRGQFETTIEEHLRSAGFTVVTHGAAVEVIGKRDLQEGCAFGPCVTAISRALDVDNLLDVRIGAEGQSYSFVVSLVDAGGFPIAQVADSCGVCTVAEALGKVGTAAGAIEGKAFPRGADAAPVARVVAPRRSKLVPALLVVSGLALAGGGTAILAATEHREPGWVTIGSGGAVLLTGLLLLITGD